MIEVELYTPTNRRFPPVDIVTNSASSYSLNVYYRTNAGGVPTNGLFLFAGVPIETVIIELFGGDTNQVRITTSSDSRCSSVPVLARPR